MRKNRSSCVTAPIFELGSQRQRVSRLPTEPPRRPAARSKNVLVNVNGNGNVNNIHPKGGKFKTFTRL